MLVRRIHQNIHRLIRSRAARGDVGRRARITGVTDPRAGQPAAPSDLVDAASLVTASYPQVPHPAQAAPRGARAAGAASLVAASSPQGPGPAEPAQRVAFGTSGHRGSSFDTAFNEAHILATTQAICEYRAAQGTDGPLFLGRDPHALSEPARARAPAPRGGAR